LKTKQVLGVIGALALTGLSTLILASPAQSAPPTCKVSTTTLTNRPDNGLNGDWAYDSFTRKVTICTVEEPAGAPWLYKATVEDTGTFVTIGGATLSPGVTPGVPLAGGVTGTMTGGFSGQFSAPADFGFAWNVHHNKTYDGAPGGSQPDANDPSTSWWIATLFGGIEQLINDWSWTYKTCNEQWINNEDTNANEDGGNITGAVPCPTRTTPTPAPAPAPGNGGLADTGSNVTGIVIAGGSALLVGAVLIAFTARRRARSHS